MPSPTPNFAIPGLSHISRPELERQRSVIRMLPHQVQNSMWAGFSAYDGPITGVMTYGDSLIFYGEGVLNFGGVTGLTTQELPFSVVCSDYPVASVIMKFGRGLADGDPGIFNLSSVPTAGWGSLDIYNAEDWKFSAPRQALPLGVGNHLWEITAVDTNGDTFICYSGELLVTD